MDGNQAFRGLDFESNTRPLHIRAEKVEVNPLVSSPLVEQACIPLSARIARAQKHGYLISRKLQVCACSEVRTIEQNHAGIGCRPNSVCPTV